MLMQSPRLPMSSNMLKSYLDSRETRYKAPLERLGLRLDDAGMPQPIPDATATAAAAVANSSSPLKRPKSSVFAVPSFSNYSMASRGVSAGAMPASTGRVAQQQQQQPAAAATVAVAPFGIPLGPATHVDLHRSDSSPSQDEESKLNDQNEETLSDNATHVMRPRGYVRAHQAELAARGRGKRGRGRGRGRGGAGGGRGGGFQNLRGVVAQANLNQQVCVCVCIPPVLYTINMCRVLGIIQN